MVTVQLSDADYELAEQQAAACALGGRSHVRAGQDRTQNLANDQLVGQLGTIALHRYWFGNVDRYVLGRYYQNRHAWEGDLGEDIPGANIDVKCSRMRASPDPLAYNLLVRPRERHEHWIYVLALLPKESERRVHLIGWLSDSELPSQPATSGPFTGAFAVPAKNLHPLPPLRYQLLPDNVR